MAMSSASANEPKYITKLAEIKKDVESFYMYFEPNYKRYNEYYNFVFKTALSPADITKLKNLQKPQIEFPILEAYISRLRGEFSKTRPQLDVHASEGIKIAPISNSQIQLMKVAQAHLNEIFFEADNDQFEYDIYSDTMAGGYSAAKISTEYVNEKSFLQKIVLNRVFDVTMVGFDPLAMKSHKGDGRFCFELFPMTREEFVLEFGEEKARSFNFTRALEGFNWSYKNQEQKIVLVAEYFVKVVKNEMLFKIAENHTGKTVMTEKEYNKMIKEWASIEQIPPILDKRKTTKTTIDRYRICQNEVLDHTETMYPMLPIVFFDGNSVMIRNETGGPRVQMTRPYVYNAMGIQKLKNFAGQTVAGEIEDMVMHKFMIPIEGIPQQYIRAYQSPQQASTLAYNQFDPKRPDIRLDPPREIQRTPTPPVVQETFLESDRTAQAILGSYDAILGINGQEISGKAIQQGAMQSDAAGIPYMMGYIKGLQRCAEICIHLMPLIYDTPRTIPVRLPNGKRDYQVINAPYKKPQPQMQPPQLGMGMQEDMMPGTADEEQMEPALMFNYDPNDLNIRVVPGVNAAVQKQVALDQLTRMMEASPTFAEFMNRQGLPTLLDNLDIRGIEGLKEMAEEFQQQMEQERKAAAEQPQDVDKLVQAEIQVAQMQNEIAQLKAQNEFVLGLAKVATEKQKVENQAVELQIKAQEIAAHVDIKNEEVASQEAHDMMRLALDVAKHQNETTKSEGEKRE